MTEYMIIVVVVGIFCMGMFMRFGQGTNFQGRMATSKLVGRVAHGEARFPLQNGVGGLGDLGDGVRFEAQRRNTMQGN